MIALTGDAALNSGCGGEDADAATVVSVLEAGEGETITLPVPYAVSQTASTSATFDTSFDLSGAGTDEAITFAFGECRVNPNLSCAQKMEVMVLS